MKLYNRDARKGVSVFILSLRAAGCFGGVAISHATNNFDFTEIASGLAPSTFAMTLLII